MNNIELAETIRKKFIPLAFTCECAGADPDCQDTLNNCCDYRQQNTALRIAKFIESLGK